VQVPETTSVEAYESYIGGKCLRACHGEAWREIKACIIASPRVVDNVHLPGVSEPFIAWTMSGQAEFQEREGDGPWITHQIRRGSLFLTTGGGIYDCRWKAFTPEPFETMLVFVGLPLIRRVLEEIFGADADNARLRDLSAFTDAEMHWLMERLHKELTRRKASPLLVQAIAQAIAVHLARNYADLVSEPHRQSVAARLQAPANHGLDGPTHGRRARPGPARLTGRLEQVSLPSPFQKCHWRVTFPLPHKS